ncbi:ATP-binding protein [Streptomyces sp. NPDC048297]|uniref:ATP-binding protein n=1 Tax=Streptomyces sp. NPDC048297 TaxID=3365531 RepID=UPI003718780E
MDPTTPGPDEHGQAPHRRSPRESLTSDFGQSTPGPARTVQVVSGDFLLTVNPVDGSEIEPCPPHRRGESARKRTTAERAEAERAARPPVPPGPSRPALSLLERQDERERLVRLLARGRSVRLTGPGGSGRTALLDLVAEDCVDLAPDGVVRLSGFHRTAEDLVRDLFHAVHDAPHHRPGPDELLALVGAIGAVVVVDDLEFGGSALEELLDATPECAFLFGATPDVPAPSAESEVEEVFLTGLDRAAGVEILERAVGRVLTEEEANWAGDLWFESEGLPLRFVQAGALLRQRDLLRASTGAVDEYGVFEDVRPTVDAGFDAPYDAPLGATETPEVPLPSLGEAAAPAPLLASRLSSSARDTLRFAVALGGEVPHQAHLPALVGDTHADTALGELAGCGLVSPVGSRYRLAAGVRTQLEAAGYDSDAAERALTAAQHYAWWAGHPSVTPERVAAEADAVLAALTMVVPATTAPVEGEEAPAVRLARAAAPAFAAGLHWGAWERALRAGAESSRLAGEVAEQAYFHHELGILALCGGQLDRARAELEAAAGLRGVLADKRGAVAGLRALSLVADLAGDVPGAVPSLLDDVPDGRRAPSASPSPGAPAAAFPAYDSADSAFRAYESDFPAYRPEETLVSSRPAAAGSRGGIRGLARRNLVAIGSGALLVAVMGTVITLGMTSHESADKNPAGSVDVTPSASQGLDDGAGDTGGTGGGGPADSGAGTGGTGTVTASPTGPGPDDTTDAPSQTAPSTGPSASRGTGGGATTPTPSTSKSTRPSTPTPSRTPPSTPPTSPSAPSSPPDSPSPSASQSSSPASSTSASGPASGSPAASSSSAGAPAPGEPVIQGDGTTPVM